MSATDPSSERDAHQFDDFPELPVCRLDYWPIFIAPSAGSGERVLCGLIGRDAHQAVAVLQLLTQASASPLLDDESTRLVDLVSRVLEEAQACLVTHHSLEEWTPSLEGVECGEKSFMHGDDPMDALRAAAYLSGGLFALKFLALSVTA